MNQTFDIHRFAMTLKLDLAEKGRGYLLMTALYLIILSLMLMPVALSSEFSTSREILHYLALIMVLLFGTSLISGGAFSQFSKNAVGMAALMVPASRLEKFLSSFLLNQLFIIFYIVIFWQMHYALFDIANSKLPTPLPHYRYIPKDFMLYSTFGYFLMHGIIFLGSVSFTKSAYIKTTFIAILTGLALCLVHYFTASNLLGVSTNLTAMPFSGWKIWILPEAGKVSEYASPYYDFPLPANALFAAQAFCCLLVAMLYTAAYFQMKERQI